MGLYVALLGALEIVLSILHSVAKRTFICNKDLKKPSKALSLEFKILHDYLSEKFPYKERGRTK